MATALKNLSEHEKVALRKPEKLRIAVVTAHWNTHVGSPGTELEFAL